MKIPINWLKDYIKLPEDKKDLAHNLTMVGHMLDKLTEIDGQIVMDLELRGNRADCYSILGIAREVAAIYDTKVKNHEILTKAKLVKHLKETNLTVKTGLVKRVMMSTIKNVKIEKSPKWLVEKLKAYGVSSINNIVDLTNFVTIETGQPMHAFDLDRIGKNIEIRLAKKGEKILTFLGQTINLDEEDLVWANKKDVLSMAGAIGEKTNSISETSKNVLLEAASYDRANIRRSIHRHNLFTEAGIRHEKELDPNLVEIGLKRFLHLLEKNKWGRASNQIYDYYPKPVKPWTIKLALNYLERLTGIIIDAREIKNILVRLNFRIIKFTNEEIEVEIPTYRTDVTLAEDLIEEIVRIYGYNKITPRTLSLEIPEVVTPNYIDQEIKIKNQMVELGFNEVITLPFVRENFQNLNLSSEIREKAVTLQNPPSPDFREMRMSMLPNLVDLAKKAINERVGEVRYFEVGKVYAHIGSKYIEKRFLGILYFRDAKKNSFAKFKGFIEGFLIKNNLSKIGYVNTSEALLANTFDVFVGKEKIGWAGEYSESKIHFVQLDLEKLLEISSQTKVKLWPKYPPQIEDITLKVPEKTKIGEIVNEMSYVKHVKKAELIDSFNDAYTFRIWYQDESKTLTDKEVVVIRNKILTVVKDKFAAVQNA